MVSKPRQRLGFKLHRSWLDLEDSQANGRVEREIQTVRGLGAVGLSPGAQAEVDV